jgi:DNA primase
VLLLEQDFEVRVLALPPVGNKKADPDLFIREMGKDAYLKLLKEAPPYVDYLIARARQMDLTTGEGKLRAVNFLLPYVQKIPNRILRSEWATRIAQQLRLDEPVLRAALSKAASERRSEVKTQPELVGRAAKPVERRLIRMLAEAEGFRHELAQQLQNARLYHGLETEKIFAALVVASLSGQPLHAAEVGAALEERDRRLFFEILLEDAAASTWRDAESCLAVLRARQIKSQLDAVERELEDQVAKNGSTSPEALEIQRGIQQLLLQAQAEVAAQEVPQTSKGKEEPDPVLEEIRVMIKNSLQRLG